MFTGRNLIECQSKNRTCVIYDVDVNEFEALQKRCYGLWSFVWNIHKLVKIILKGASEMHGQL